jgi:hypothetical protein
MPPAAAGPPPPFIARPFAGAAARQPRHLSLPDASDAYRRSALAMTALGTKAARYPVQGSAIICVTRNDICIS